MRKLLRNNKYVCDLLVKKTTQFKVEAIYTDGIIDKASDLIYFFVA